MQKRARKYVFVVGGVMSGVGKGIATASIGRILKAKGFRVTAVKIDPYINVDAGTMNPTVHGETFVLADGYETDQDMGNYERFLDVTLPDINYMTTGRVYQEVLRRERNLEYKGQCVEVVPHIPLEVIRRIENATEEADAEVTLVEIGGTIGEYQNIIFLEAARMLKFRKPQDVAVVMVSYVPIPGNIGEMKTKPTQYAARSLNSVGLQADVIIARAPLPLDTKRKEKIALFCNIAKERVISAPDVKSIYDVPLNFERDQLGRILQETLAMKPERRGAGLLRWKNFAKKTHNGKQALKIAVVGKYFDSGDFMLSDVYISVIEAIKFSSYEVNARPELTWIDSKEFETGEKQVAILKDFDGIVVPGGFGKTGVEGLVLAIKYAREHKIPYLGLCYGMQWMVVEFARHVARMKGAHSTEVDELTPYPVIDIMPDQKEKLVRKDYGGSMRLGSYPAYLKKGTIAREAYRQEIVDERHRHRFEVNPIYIDRLEKAGLVFSGISPNRKLMEIAELPRDVHPFMLGTQFHPELQARPLSPHPLFTAFMQAAADRKKH